jgi:small subunit ribosomal protein S9
MNQFLTTGRRKEAVARVRLQLSGKGKFTVNGHELADYLCRSTLVDHVCEPLKLTEHFGTVDINATTSGGGLSGQAGAIRLAVSRALVEMNPDLRAPLRKAGMMTRDSREVERKKYGQPKARKRFQYSKR